ncbi:MAG: DUF362 domain-containing protein, partial [Candidatus Aminicenantales bacterium]
SLLGGLDRFIKKGSRVFVKINHLSPPSRPEEAIVTHPEFTRAVCRLLKENGCVLTVGDDIQSRDKDGFLISGYRKMCEEEGLRLINLKESGFQEIRCQGRLLESLYVSPLVLEADHIVNLPKLKTHSLTALTGAVKNMYGIIPHGLRKLFHRRYPTPDLFSEMLVDIYACAVPQLNIMDAVVGMEGEGPSAGAPKKLGLVMASPDGVALDAVASEVIGLDPRLVATTRHAAERDLGRARLEDIQVLGENIETARVSDFRISTISLGLIQRRFPALLQGFIQDQLTRIPKINRKHCTSCRECVEICPTGAARMVDGKAWIQPAWCIHCMCCHEVCRFHAVDLGERPFGKAIRYLTSAYRRVMSLFA